MNIPPLELHPPFLGQTTWKSVASCVSRLRCKVYDGNVRSDAAHGQHIDTGTASCFFPGGLEKQNRRFFGRNTWDLRGLTPLDVTSSAERLKVRSRFFHYSIARLFLKSSKKRHVDSVRLADHSYKPTEMTPEIQTHSCGSPDTAL